MFDTCCVAPVATGSCCCCCRGCWACCWCCWCTCGCWYCCGCCCCMRAAMPDPTTCAAASCCAAVSRPHSSPRKSCACCRALSDCPTAASPPTPAPGVMDAAALLLAKCPPCRLCPCSCSCLPPPAAIACPRKPAAISRPRDSGDLFADVARPPPRLCPCCPGVRARGAPGLPLRPEAARRRLRPCRPLSSPAARVFLLVRLPAVAALRLRL